MIIWLMPNISQRKTRINQTTITISSIFKWPRYGCAIENIELKLLFLAKKFMLIVYFIALNCEYVKKPKKKKAHKEWNVTRKSRMTISNQRKKKMENTTSNTNERTLFLTKFENSWILSFLVFGANYVWIYALRKVIPYDVYKLNTGRESVARECTVTGVDILHILALYISITLK